MEVSKNIGENELEGWLEKLSTKSLTLRKKWHKM